MDELATTLLNFERAEARRAWIGLHCPTADYALVQYLHEEALRLEKDNPHQTLSIADVVDDLAFAWNDEPTRVEALLIRANGLRLLGEPKEAVTLYESAVETYQSLGLPHKAASATIGQIDTLMYLGRYDEAIELADWAIPQLKDAGDMERTGRILLNQGNLFARLGRFAEARHNYAEAHDIFSTLGYERDIAIVEANDATALEAIDDFEQAAQKYTRVRKLFEQLDMTSAVAQVDHNLANLHFSLGEYQRALSTYTSVRQVYEAMQATIDIAYTDLYRSDVYLALNLWTEALELARSARKVFADAAYSVETARLWLNESVALAHMQVPEGAADALHEAQAILTAERNTRWLALVDLYRATFNLHSGDLSDVRAAAERAQRAFTKSGQLSRIAQAHNLLGEINLLNNDIHQALQQFERSLETLNDLDLPAVTYAAHFGLGRVFQQQGDSAKARLHYRRAVHHLERLQAAIGAEDYRTAFRRDKLSVYEKLTALCLESREADDIAEAFRTIERAKSRNLAESIARGSFQAKDHQPNHSENVAGFSNGGHANSQLAELSLLRRELNWYYNQLYLPSLEQGQPQREVRQVVNAISHRERRVQRLLRTEQNLDAQTPYPSFDAASLHQVQQTLPTAAVLLEFFFVEGKIAVLGITQQDSWIQILDVTRNEISQAIASLDFQLGKFNLGQGYWERHRNQLQVGVDETLSWLYTALIAPLAARLEAELLIFAPHDLLHYIPFHALRAGDAYLVESKTISYVPSATVLHSLLEQPELNSNGRAPQIVSVQDETIPHVRAETQIIAGLFPGATLQTGQAASTRSFFAEQTQPAFLHLATHATFRSDNPLFSALKLTDGWVNVYDLYTLKHAAPLVTLSACATGRNQIEAGDELVGLCRGFFSAGTQALVTSLWPVDDQTTAHFMRYFYKALRLGQSTSQALRNAQLEILSNQTHPYFWAPFFVTGHPLLHLPKDI